MEYIILIAIIFHACVSYALANLNKNLLDTKRQNFHLDFAETIKAHSRWNKITPSNDFANPTTTTLGYITASFYDSSNSTNCSGAVAYAESVQLGICYPSSANLTSFYQWNFNNITNVVELKIFSSSSCTGSYREGLNTTLGCTENGGDTYFVSTTSTFTWGKTSGYGLVYYSTKDSCLNHDGDINGGYLVTTGKNGCVSTSAFTSTQVYCASLMIHFKYFSSPDCTGPYSLDAIDKNSSCGDVQYYDYMYGYPYYDCFKLGHSTRAPTRKPTKKPTRKPTKKPSNKPTKKPSSNAQLLVAH